MRKKHLINYLLLIVLFIFSSLFSCNSKPIDNTSTGLSETALEGTIDAKQTDSISSGLSETAAESESGVFGDLVPVTADDLSVYPKYTTFGTVIDYGPGFAKEVFHSDLPTVDDYMLTLHSYGYNDVYNEGLQTPDKKKTVKIGDREFQCSYSGSRYYINEYDNGMIDVDMIRSVSLSDNENIKSYLSCDIYKNDDGYGSFQFAAYSDELIYCTLPTGGDKTEPDTVLSDAEIKEKAIFYAENYFFRNTDGYETVIGSGSSSSVCHVFFYKKYNEHNYRGFTVSITRSGKLWLYEAHTHRFTEPDNMFINIDYNTEKFDPLTEEQKSSVLQSIESWIEKTIKPKVDSVRVTYKEPIIKRYGYSGTLCAVTSAYFIVHSGSNRSEIVYDFYTILE